MNITTLGWAGIQIDHDGHRLVIDAFADPGPFEAFLTAPMEELTVAPEGPVDAALLTHLHRDHADAVTLAKVLRPGAPILGPERSGGLCDEATLGPEAELAAAGLELTRAGEGFGTTLGPFEVTAVFAVDGLGDPQVSWIVAAGGHRILHGGDTVWHGAWWRIAKRHGPIDVAFLPANGARIDFPWLQPAVDAPAALTPEQAVEAARALGAGELVAIHHSALSHEQLYRPREYAPDAVAAAAAERGIAARAAVPGEEIQLQVA
jgi:L-ascorbate metabolism protein UlaG (beta-lactamase superfamily)